MDLLIMRMVERSQVKSKVQPIVQTKSKQIHGVSPGSSGISASFVGPGVACWCGGIVRNFLFLSNCEFLYQDGKVCPEKNIPTFQLNIDNGNSSVFIPTPKCLGHLEDLKLSRLVVSGMNTSHSGGKHKMNLMPVTQWLTNNNCCL